MAMGAMTAATSVSILLLLATLAAGVPHPRHDRVSRSVSPDKELLYRVLNRAMETDAPELHEAHKDRLRGVLEELEKRAEVLKTDDVQQVDKIDTSKIDTQTVVSVQDFNKKLPDYILPVNDVQLEIKMEADKDFHLEKTLDPQRDMVTLTLDNIPLNTPTCGATSSSSCRAKITDLDERLKPYLEGFSVEQRLEALVYQSKAMQAMVSAFTKKKTPLRFDIAKYNLIDDMVMDAAQAKDLYYEVLLAIENGDFDAGRVAVNPESDTTVLQQVNTQVTDLTKIQREMDPEIEAAETSRKERLRELLSTLKERLGQRETELDPEEQVDSPMERDAEEDSPMTGEDLEMREALIGKLRSLLHREKRQLADDGTEVQVENQEQDEEEEGLGEINVQELRDFLSDAGYDPEAEGQGEEDQEEMLRSMLERIVDLDAGRGLGMDEDGPPDALQDAPEEGEGQEVETVQRIQELEEILTQTQDQDIQNEILRELDALETPDTRHLEEPEAGELAEYLEDNEEDEEMDEDTRKLVEELSNSLEDELRKFVEEKKRRPVAALDQVDDDTRVVDEQFQDQQTQLDDLLKRAFEEYGLDQDKRGDDEETEGEDIMEYMRVLKENLLDDLDKEMDEALQERDERQQLTDELERLQRGMEDPDHLVDAKRKKRDVDLDGLKDALREHLAAEMRDEDEMEGQGTLETRGEGQSIADHLKNLGTHRGDDKETIKKLAEILNAVENAEEAAGGNGGQGQGQSQEEPGGGEVAEGEGGARYLEDELMEDTEDEVYDEDREFFESAMMDALDEEDDEGDITAEAERELFRKISDLLDHTPEERSDSSGNQGGTPPHERIPTNQALIEALEVLVEQERKNNEKFQDEKDKRDMANDRTERKLTTDSNWGTTIKYYYYASFSSSQKSSILTALYHWQGSTCLKFTYGKPFLGLGPHLKFEKTSNPNICGSSPVGKKAFGNTIKINCFDLGTIAHEVGHSLGFWHEQSRPDRDRYVKILWGNIANAYKYNFNKKSWKNVLAHGVPYEHWSLMHYSKTAFGSGKTTIQTWDTKLQDVIGQRRQLSFYDFKLANLHFCSSKCSGGLHWGSCQHDGYKNPKNCGKCICQDGWTGTYCQTVQTNTGKCGTPYLTATTTKKYFNSPGYFSPGYYKYADHCVWLITAPVHKHVYAKFESTFKLRSNCREDWVEVRYRESGLSLSGTRHCGSSKPGFTFVSKGRQMMVLFRAYGSTSTSLKGFRMSYWTTSSDCGLCNKVYSPSPACYTSEKYSCPGSYSCGWWGSSRCYRSNTCYRTRYYCCNPHVLSGSWCKVRGCGGCTDKNVQNQPACAATLPAYKVGTYKKSYKCGLFGWKRCYKTGYKAVLYYTHGSYYCCHGYKLVGSRCIKEVAGCGGCVNTVVTNQPACRDKKIKYYTYTSAQSYKCGFLNWKRCYRKKYHKSSYYYYGPFYCCSGYTVSGDRCIK